MNSKHENLDAIEKLMLVQGISLINDGLDFIGWVEGFPNDLSYELYDLLFERFKAFQQCVLDGATDHLVIDRASKHLENVIYCRDFSKKVHKQMMELQEQVVRIRHEKEKDE